MQKLEGKSVAQQVKNQVKTAVEALLQKGQRPPGLAVVLVGEDPASQVYVGSKIKSCLEVGVQSYEHRLSATVTENELLAMIETLNRQTEVDGILVQLPLPKGLNEAKVLAAIDPLKDVDGLSSENLGLLCQNKTRVAACTPAGVIEILKFYGHKMEGLRAVVVGRSQIVGLPMAQLLLQQNATVTICHSRTKDLRSYTKNADLVVVAAGKPRFLGAEDFSSDAIVVDVGIHRGADGKLCGDVRSEELKVKAFTPVPGGVGPMTIAMLMKNTLDLYKIHTGVKDV